MLKFRSMVFAACLAWLMFGTMPALAQEHPAKPSAPYLDPSLPIDQRVDDLVGRMTLQEKTSQVVHRAAGIPRLGIPAYNWWNEALHGVLTKNATVFPEPIGLGATFDSPLVHEMAEVVGIEARGKYNENVAAHR